MLYLCLPLGWVYLQSIFSGRPHCSIRHNHLFCLFCNQNPPPENKLITFYVKARESPYLRNGTSDHQNEKRWPLLFGNCQKPLLAPRKCFFDHCYIQNAYFLKILSPPDFHYLEVNSFITTGQKPLSPPTFFFGRLGSFSKAMWCGHHNICMYQNITQT